ncbi:MAG: trans-2-enoyl-CoA reductase family protein [Opitutales bacterium]|nr:trans-2-enoyl-CoA reductase family protein [Opitutales bacterium]
MIIKPRIRGFVCITAHPDGCEAHVKEQIEHVRKNGPVKDGPRKVLVIGASTGYGLATRIAATFGSKADSIGVFFERPPQDGKLGTPGWYNTVAFDKFAREEGVYAGHVNGDAFSNEIRETTIQAVRKHLGQVDLVVYSLASPRRTHPITGETHRSTLKPIGQSFRNKTVDTDKGVVSEVELEPATEKEIEDTVAVMGGEDWEMWIEALHRENLLAPGATSMAYSYIGPDVTWPIYRKGTIGKAKEHLEKTAGKIDALLKMTQGRAFVSVNKAVVTQASSAIPVVPLYISILFKVMKEKKLHEDCIQQITRLFTDQLYNDRALLFDENGLVRIDDWEMKKDVQEEVAALWPKVTTENIEELSDLAEYRKNFLKLFGFGLPGVDYEADTDPQRDLPLLNEG